MMEAQKPIEYKDPLQEFIDSTRERFRNIPLDAYEEKSQAQSINTRHQCSHFQARVQQVLTSLVQYL